MGGVLEHRALTDLTTAARANLLATYIGLASGVPGSTTHHREGYTLCEAASDLSFANFAAGFDLPSDGSAAFQAYSALVSRAWAVPNFWVFTTSGDQPPDLDRRLEERGFQRRQALSVLAWHGRAPGDAVPVWRAESSLERAHVAAFMAMQFFWRSRPDVRERISRATMASGHSLIGTGRADALEGAVMTVRTEGCLGLYNLCVREEARGRGLGSGIVAAVQCAAAAHGLPVVLQCDEGLVGWYLKRGFEAIGRVHAYGFSRTSPSDII